MMPHHGRGFEDEMARFEAEINAARAQAFIVGGAVQGFSQPTISAAPSSSKSKKV